MKKILALLMCSGCCLTAGAETKIHLPDGVSIVPRDCLLIVTSDDPIIILQAPDVGILKVQRVKTPWHLYEKFADGDGEREYRVYDSPHVWVVTAGKPGSTELLLIPEGVTDAESIVRRTLTVAGIGPNPPPGPGPGPTPEPGPGPGPVTSFRVIFVKESGTTLNAQQSAIPSAKAIRDYLNAKATPESGLPGWREYDPDQITTTEQATMSALWAAVKPRLTPAPCMVIEVSGHATVMPFPASVEDCLATLKKYGGQ